ncbi:UDP-N-acetylmuramate dehydrogenase [Streptomyces sp. SID4985]|uniref:UDP-N-acetylmuramate dehydrogenase n=1 Tax=Streptomyces sp. SID4985 TaxID=2690292 RepID=UPI001367C314|nr:UDP-N-acetylmuramate dehydrogenase [Streptomyces sp. SID4985]MYQ45534.1 UDP-N-acetylmuramate dehydrogenase [Streptomyces sp. SID4985]
MGEFLADHTTLRLGGPADQFLTHTDPTAWPDLARAPQGDGQTPFVLGGGSNTLAADTGAPGTVIRMATRGITARPLGQDGVEVVAQAGEPLGSLVAFTVAEGLSGVEYLGGIPGTVGAAPVQNTGAYGQQISDTLTSITAHDWQHGHTVELLPSECGFGYRSSIFKSRPGRWTILTVTLRLNLSQVAAPVSYGHLAGALDVPLGSQPPLAEAASGVIADRETRGLTLPASGPEARQAGSAFLNPPVTDEQAAAVRAAGGPVHTDMRGVMRASSGWLLTQCGYQPGLRLANGVFCSAHRVLTVTVRDGAASRDVARVLHTMASRVLSSTGVQLHPEIVTLGM